MKFIPKLSLGTLPYLLASELTHSSLPKHQMTHNTLLLPALFLLLLLTPTTSLAYITKNAPTKPPLRPSSFREAPIFRNGVGCPPKTSPSSIIHIAMTLDTTYLRGSIAGVLSVLQHAACPENVAFHFLHSSRRRLLLRTVAAVFPDLPFRLYPFDSALVRNKISSSVRTALDQPLNYARIYLADVLPAAVPRVIYLDSDLVLVDDVAKLWSTPLPSPSSVLAAPEYCHANFSSYLMKGEFIMSSPKKKKGKEAHLAQQPYDDIKGKRESFYWPKDTRTPLVEIPQFC